MSLLTGSERTATLAEAQSAVSRDRVQSRLVDRIANRMPIFFEP